MRRIAVRKLQSALKKASIALKSKKAYGMPPLIQIEPTNRCNLKCKMCFRNYFTKSTRIGTMKFSDFKKLINSINGVKKIILSGYGEPFMNKDIIRMIKYSKSKGISTGVFSNFTLIDKKIARKIVVSKLDWISASIDGIRSYKKIRGVELKKTLNRIINLIEARRVSNTKLPYIRIGYTIMNDNVDEIEDMVRLCSDLGVDELAFKTVVDITKKKNLEIKNLRKLSKVIKNAERLSKKLNLKTNLAELHKRIYSRPEKKTRRVFCIVPWYRPFISWYGGVRPCCDFFDSFVECGNVFDEDFKKIWNNNNFKNFRAILLNGRAPHEICLKCAQRLEGI